MSHKLRNKKGRFIKGHGKVPKSRRKKSRRTGARCARTIVCRNKRGRYTRRSRR